MDPKSISNMDPKLRETYERVMGTTVTPSAPSSNTNHPASPASFPSAIPTTGQAVDAPPAPAPAPTASPAQNAELTPPFTPAPPLTPVVPTTVSQAAPAGAFQPLPSPAAVNQALASQGDSSMKKILYILGALIFFGLYSYFWIKVFGLRFPF